MEEAEIRRLASFELSLALGIEYIEISQERVVATMALTSFHHQPYGYLHGGVNLFFSETVAGVGGYTYCPPGKTVFGLEINANHLRPVREGVLRAVSTPLHIGRSTQVWDIKIMDDRERLVCVSRCTLAVVDTAEQPVAGAGDHNGANST